jgi:hypothetical protein
VAAADFASPPFVDHSHGTNVAATVLGVAPGARIAALNVFRPPAVRLYSHWSARSIGASPIDQYSTSFQLT